MDSARQLIDQAVAAIQSGNHKQALEYLDEAVQLEPESAEIYSLRGIAFANTRRGEAATESFRKARRCSSLRLGASTTLPFTC